jgi:hypothetical protein
MSAPSRLFDRVAVSVDNYFFDFTATGRAFVQAALRTKRRTRLAAFFAERDFATFTAQHDVPPPVDRCAAAQNRPLVQPADGALRGNPLLAALLAVLFFAAQPA